MTSEVTTRVLGAAEHSRWAEQVAVSPDGSAYALPQYLEVLCEVAGGRYRVLVAERAGEIVGGIALYERSLRTGCYVAPRLLLYYNGFVLMAHATKYPSQREAWRLQTLGALERALSQRGYAHLKIKSRSTLSDVRAFCARGWAAQPSYSYVVDIADLPAAWARVDKNLRRLVTRCREQGLTLSRDDDFEIFYTLHAQTHQRKGAHLYLPREAFARYVARLQALGLARLYHARLPDGRAIASQLVLTGPHPVTHTVCAAADAQFLNLGASAFLRWEVFEDLSRAGYRGNDLTDAALNPVSHFKSQLGGELCLGLQIARPDRLAWRLHAGASGLPERCKELALRMLRRRARENAP